MGCVESKATKNQRKQNDHQKTETKPGYTTFDPKQKKNKVLQKDKQTKFQIHSKQKIIPNSLLNQISLQQMKSLLSNQTQLLNKIEKIYEQKISMLPIQSQRSQISRIQSQFFQKKVSDLYQKNLYPNINIIPFKCQQKYDHKLDQLVLEQIIRINKNYLLLEQKKSIANKTKQFIQITNKKIQELEKEQRQQFIQVLRENKILKSNYCDQDQQKIINENEKNCFRDFIKLKLGQKKKQCKAQYQGLKQVYLKQVDNSQNTQLKKSALTNIQIEWPKDFTEQKKIQFKENIEKAYSQQIYKQIQQQKNRLKLEKISSDHSNELQKVWKTKVEELYQIVADQNQRIRQQYDNQCGCKPF